MNVFYFSSDLFASVLATSMVSLMENNKAFDSINIYVIDDGISKTSKEKLEGLVQRYDRSLTFIPAPSPNELFDFPFTDRYQMGHSYPRMAIGTLLPDSVDRVLALDSDTMILGNLSKLWDMDMKDNILAGVMDCMNIKKYRKQFGLGTGEFYCNAGVYLIDLKKWREQHIEDVIKDRIQQNNGNVFFFEQTLMNYSCRGKIAKLHPKYNTYTLFYAFSYENLMRWRNPSNFYSKKHVEEAKEAPLIIHFTRNFYMMSRPWVKGCDHPLTEEYVKYKKMTPWPNLEEDNRPAKARFKYALWHSVPQSLLALVAGFIYNEVRPKMWWRNE